MRIESRGRPTPGLPGLPGLLGLLGLVSGLGACGPGQTPRPRQAQTTRPPARSAPRAADGEPCGTMADCQPGLVCHDRLCLDPACPWSLACLKKLGAAHANTSLGIKTGRWLRRLSEYPTATACRDTPKRIADLFSAVPWQWKAVCGPPPVPGVHMARDRLHPFKINEHQIKASGIPSDEKPEILSQHRALPDLCKAWVDLTLTRRFQGFVRARVYEQYDCTAASAAVRKADPSAKPGCKTRLYPRFDQRYIPLHAAGSRLSLSFYFSTPPEVCRNPNLTDKTYPMGCFCLGIDETKLTLEAVEDPFLFEDALPGARRPLPAGPAPGNGTGPVGIPSCDDFIRIFTCYIARMPLSAQGPAHSSMQQMIAFWRKGTAMSDAAGRQAVAKGCQTALQAWRKAMANNPMTKDCLGP